MITLQKTLFRISSDYNWPLFNNMLAGRFIPACTERVCEGLGSLGGKLWDLNAEERNRLENDTDDEAVLDVNK